MDQQAPEEKIRKTISLTHKQAGIGGSALALLLYLQPTLNKFVTRDEIKSSEVVVTELQKSVATLNDRIDDSKREIVEIIRRSNDLRRQEASATENRQRATDDRQDRATEALQVFAFKTKPNRSAN